MEKMEERENFIHNKYGYCFYSVEDNTAMIYNLYIEQNYRKKGHAENLIRLVIREIRGTGYNGEIQIEAQPREDSISIEYLVTFYERLGLRVISAP
jgi:ribosomal protein S18 acetylase RimI-like enzyme